MVSARFDFGEYLHQLRTTNGYSQKKVADKLGIDISLLSRIEHGERPLQGHMLKGISEIFNLDYKSLCVNYLSSKLHENFGKEPYIKEAAKNWLSQIE